MQISPAEKLILLMLTEIYDNLKINREVDPGFLRSALLDGQHWAIDWKMPGIVEPPVGEDVPNEVASIMAMHSALEDAYKALSAPDKATVQLGRIQFRGFDGNNETDHMSVARFLVEEMNRFTEFKGRDFNSHMPTVERSKRMLRAYNTIRDAAGSGLHKLTANQINQIANA